MISHRGLSTVVVSGILLSAVAMIGTGIISWSQTMLSEHQQNLQSTFDTNINKINEYITIEHTWFGGTTCSPLDKFANVTLTNDGVIGLNITSIKFIDSSNSQTLWTLTDGGVVPNAVYNFQQNYCWISGSTIDIIIDTDRGNIFRGQVSP